MTTALHTERVGSASASLVVGIAHGIFGRGMNWRTFAKRWVATRSDLAIELIDLREHGRSRGFPEPHNIASAATDLVHTVRALKIDALVGHSFGGKVVMGARAELELLFSLIVDSSPSARPEGLAPDSMISVAARALQILESLPPLFDSRSTFVSAITARGLATGVGQFLATNLVRAGSDESESWRLGLDLVAIRSLMLSYYNTDLWSLVERPDLGRLVFAMASRESALSAADKSRLADQSLGMEHLSVSELDAGHWVHVDAPAELLELASSLTQQY